MKTWIAVLMVMAMTASAAERRAEDEQLVRSMRAANVKSAGERVVVWAPAGWPEGRRAAVTASLDRAVVAVEKVLGRSHDTTIEYFITDSDDVPSHVYGAYEHDPARDFPYVFLSGLDSGEAPHIHETAHLVGGKFGSLLLREGIATYVQFVLEPGRKVRPLVKLGAADLQSLDAAVAQIVAKPQNRELVQRWIADPARKVEFRSRPERSLFYAVSASFTAFLVDRMGMEAFMKAYAADDAKAAIPSWQDHADDWLRTHSR